MYRLSPNNQYLLSGFTTHYESSDPTQWINTYFTVKHDASIPSSDLFITGFGNSKYQGKEFGFLLLGQYNIKTGVGKLFKQHLLHPYDAITNWPNKESSCFSNEIRDLLRLEDNNMHYNFCLFNEQFTDHFDNSDQSQHLELHLASKYAFGTLKIQKLTLQNQNVETKSNTSFHCDSSAVNQDDSIPATCSQCNNHMSHLFETTEKEKALFSFYLRHSRYTKNESSENLLYAEIKYPRENTAFYYRAGFKIGGWDRKSEENELDVKITQKTI